MTEVEWLDIFAKNLKSIMKERKCSNIDLANDTNLTDVTIGRYLTKQRLPSLKAIINISYALDCSIDDLIDFGSTID